MRILRESIGSRATALVLALAVLLTASLLVKAAPPSPPLLPSTFYGQVQLDGANVPAAFLISAWINGEKYAEVAVKTEQGVSVYDMDVPADDPDTAGTQGGVDGDTIQFKIGDVLASQTATWIGGAMEPLHLTGSTPGGQSASVMLGTGWNLVSIPLSPHSTVITDVLSSTDGKYDLAYAYDALDAGDPWKKYNTAAPSFLNDLTDVDETIGFWIRCTEPVTLTVSGTVPSSPTISLYAGWNLVGYPSQTTRPIAEALASIDGPYDLVYAYDASDIADPWKKYNTAAPSFLNDLTEMGPGWGYWIRVSEDCTWSVQ